MRNYIFDIDGTLIDSAAVDQVAFRQALADFGHSYTPEELRFSFGMPGRKALEMLGVSDIDAVIARWEMLAYAKLHEIAVYDGVIELLETLRADGKKCGIVTSRTRWQFEQGVTPLGIHQYFDEAICADDVENPKPAPDELIECIRRLGGTAAESIYVGDSPYDMQCAKSAGVKSALALWGCEGPDRPEADVYLTHPSELLTL